MNVIVSNRQKDIIDNANIDAIKDLNGLFNVDDLINKFKNYFFSKMILDATSVIDFATEEVLKKLADEIGSDRLIILLPSTPEPPEEFKKMLIDLKIYNFSNKIEDVVKYIDNPNTYENAMNEIMNSYNNSNGFYVDNSINDGNSQNYEDSENVVSDSQNNDSESNYTENSRYNDYNDIPNNHSSLGDIISRMSLNTSEFSNSNENNDDSKNADNIDIGVDNYDIDYESDDSDQGVQNENEDYSSTLVNNNEASTNIFLNMNDFDSTIDDDKNTSKKIIGFKNITLHAGSTTLIYMLNKVASERNKRVLSIEIDKNDFKFFRNSKMISVKNDNVLNVIDSSKEEIVFVDLNDSQDNSFCDEIIYLVEPSTIKLNMLMAQNKSTFNELSDKKVVLNKSMLSKDDISILEREAGMKFFFNVGSVNDRINNSVISELFDKLIVSE